jgi:hypothetical protein
MHRAQKAMAQAKELRSRIGAQIAALHELQGAGVDDDRGLGDCEPHVLGTDGLLRSTQGAGTSTGTSTSTGSRACQRVGNAAIPGSKSTERLKCEPQTSVGHRGPGESRAAAADGPGVEAALIGGLSRDNHTLRSCPATRSTDSKGLPNATRSATSKREVYSAASCATTCCASRRCHASRAAARSGHVAHRLSSPSRRPTQCHSRH